MNRFLCLFYVMPLCDETFLMTGLGKFKIMEKEMRYIR